VKLQFQHVGHHPGLTIVVSESNHSDAVPMVTELFMRGQAVRSDDQAAVLAAVVLLHDYVGDTIELPYPVGVSFAEAIRVLCPQTISIGPVNGDNRSPSTGEVDAICRRALAEPRPQSVSEPTALTIEWHSDFVMASDVGMTSQNFAFGRVFTNATLVASEPLVDIAMALFAVGSRLGRLHVPSLQSHQPSPSLLRVSRALDLVGVTLLGT
jgi:hypothetical protein